MTDECYIYAFLSGGHQQRLLFEDLHSALYSALCDQRDGEATPIGIRRGEHILYRHSALVALYATHATDLSSGRDWPVIEALAALEAPDARRPA